MSDIFCRVPDTAAIFSRLTPDSGRRSQPTGVIMRLLGKDLLDRKIDRSASSYWVEREEPDGSMRNQF